MDNVFQEILDKVNYPPQTNLQSDQDYLSGLLEFISELPEDKWNDLSLGIQEWQNRAAGARNAYEPIPFPIGFKGYEGEPEVVEEEKAVPTPAPKTPKTKEVKKSQGRKKRGHTSGVITAIRRTIIRNPRWKAREVYEYVKQNGFPAANLSTISVEICYIRSIMELLAEEGKLNANPVQAESNPTDSTETEQVTSPL